MESGHGDLRSMINGTRTVDEGHKYALVRMILFWEFLRVIYRNCKCEICANILISPNYITEAQMPVICFLALQTFHPPILQCHSLTNIVHIERTVFYSIVHARTSWFSRHVPCHLLSAHNFRPILNIYESS